MIETAGWPAILQIQAFYWLFGTFTTVTSVNNAKDMYCSTGTVRFYRWQNWQRAWQSVASARREECRQSFSEATERRRAPHASGDRSLLRKPRLQWHQYIWVRLPRVVDSRWPPMGFSRPVKRLKRRTTIDQSHGVVSSNAQAALSLIIQNTMSLQPHRRFSRSVAAQQRRCWHCLLSAGTQPATLPKSHS